MLKNQEYLETIGISNEKLRSMIELAQKSSFGAKITGAGGGGCIIALTDESNLEKMIEQFKKGHYTDGLIAGIKEAGRVLQKHFPFEKGDSNELPDEAIIK